MKKRIRHGGSPRRGYWEEVIRRWRESGQSVRAFCRAEGLRESAFYFWRRQLAGVGQRSRKRLPEAVNDSRCQAPLGTRPHGLTPSFLPVHVVEPASGCSTAAEGNHGVEIVLSQGRTVRVRAGFDRQTLADVLAVLEARPC